MVQKSQPTTWDVWNPINNGINDISTGSSTVSFLRGLFTLGLAGPSPCKSPAEASAVALGWTSWQQKPIAPYEMEMEANFTSTMRALDLGSRKNFGRPKSQKAVNDWNLEHRRDMPREPLVLRCPKKTDGFPNANNWSVTTDPSSHWSNKPFEPFGSCFRCCKTVSQDYSDYTAMSRLLIRLF